MNEERQKPELQEYSNDEAQMILIALSVQIEISKRLGGKADMLDGVMEKLTVNLTPEDKLAVGKKAKDVYEHIVKTILSQAKCYDPTCPDCNPPNVGAGGMVN